MSKSLTKKINIFLTVDYQTLNGYFNPHDPSPLYKRQIHYKLDEYMMECVSTAKRYSVIFYKLNCTNAVDKQYTEPLMYAIRRHFAKKKSIREEEFKKFKRRNWLVLCVSSFVVIIFQALLPLVLKDNTGFLNGFKNFIDVFSWVILWKPIYELIFNWNPHLKEIGLFHKLATAEVIMIDKHVTGDTKASAKQFTEEISELQVSESLKPILQYE
jgi:hypothetical protein